MIWFDYKSSDDFHVIVERYPDVILPTRKSERISVPGRSGDLLIQQDAFENVKQRYQIYISAEEMRLPTITHQIAEWLCVKGYRRLEDTYWLDTFRLANFTGGVEIKNILNRFGKATIEFDCKPQRFFKSGDFYMDITNGQKLRNPSSFTAKPLIVVQGSGSGSISDGVNTLTLSDCDNMIIDCDLMQIYHGSTYTNYNGSGSFLALYKNSTITFTGGITSVKIKPRWFTI